MTEDKTNRKHDNVIPFPKGKEAKPQPKLNPEVKDTLFFDFNGQKLIVTSALVTAMVLTTLLNFSLERMPSFDTVTVVQTETSGFNRFPADENERERVLEMRKTSSQTLARQLASVDPEAPVKQAHSGRQPNAIEQLRYGNLANKYAVAFDDGKIRGIRYQQAQDETPNYIQDRRQFVMANRGLFSIQFDEIAEVRIKKSKERTVETYYLADSAQQPVGAHCLRAGQVRSISLDEGPET